MDTLLLSSAVGKLSDKRFGISWARKSTPLKSSLLFNRARHSEEWHQSVEATAGVLRPSDPKFPHAFLRNHTDGYLSKKGKITQADADIRLAILVEAHNEKDIAVAAVAHAMSAKSLRALLPTEVNVAQGSYWGLESWLQSLIAANYGNAASVTDLEALWARHLLPYATHGAAAAGNFLKGMSRAFRKTSITNMNAIPEFSILFRRAVTDFSAYLDGLRLRSQWVTAHEAVFWMLELERSPPSIIPHQDLCIELLFDSLFPTWRLWAEWRPEIARIKRYAGIDSISLASVPDLVGLEGPDIITWQRSTLREGLVAQYKSERPWIRVGALVIEVPDRTREGLRSTLERAARGLEYISEEMAMNTDRKSLFAFFRDLTTAQPITNECLDLFEATVRLPSISNKIDVCDTIREVYMERRELGGQNILALQRIIRILHEPAAESLRALLLRPWLLEGIERCIEDCQNAVRAQINSSSPWTLLASDLHAFCSSLKESKCDLIPKAESVQAQLELLPTIEEMRMVLDIYAAACAAQRRRIVKVDSPQNEKLDGSARPQSSEALKNRHPLEPVIEEFCKHRLLGQKKSYPVIQRSMDAILNVWKNTIDATGTIDVERRTLAVLLSKNTGSNSELSCKCLAEITVVRQSSPSSNFLKSFLAILLRVDSERERSIVDLTKLLSESGVQAQCWRDLLYGWIESGDIQQGKDEGRLIDYALHTLKAAEWISFVSSIETIFGDLPFPAFQERIVPHILRPQLLSWVIRLSGFTVTLTRLESSVACSEAIRSILICGQGHWNKNLISILECLQKVEGKPVENLMQKVVGRLSGVSKNAWDIKECCYALSIAASTTIEMCEQLWELKGGFLALPDLAPQKDEGQGTISRGFLGKASSMLSSSSSRPVSTIQTYDTSFQSKEALVPKTTVPPAVAEVMVAGWLQDKTADDKTIFAIKVIAQLLDVQVYEKDVPSPKIVEATTFWDSIEADIINEVERLERLQRALKIADPKGTALLLEELGIPDDSLLDEEIMKLPAGVIDVVEKIGKNEVEISFPMNAYTELYRNAMGVPTTATTLLLRLNLDLSRDIQPSFCVHFTDDPDLDTLEHTPWICADEIPCPQHNFCKSRQTAFTWQLHRVLYLHLKTGNVRIAELHTFVTTKLKDLGQSCVSCGTSHNAWNARLRRSTPCSIIACAQLWYQLPLDVRVPEIKTDTFAVDMMLTSVYAAAMSGRPELLPGCPIQGNEVIKTILNSLPSVTVISHAVNLSTVLRSYHKDAERLISWACVHFRGYLASASGICKIPNLPTGTHQFVLVNASPKLENDFVSRLPKSNPKTTVLFHGTSLDRLPAILAQGLKVCSGTSLQRTGAAHGKGIYMAEDPSTSFTYSPAGLSWRNSGLTNMRLVFGCEVAGNGRSVSSGIHVITDEQSVMVRYVFLFPNHAAAPVANHVIPAMASGMSALRNGVV